MHQRDDVTASGTGSRVSAGRPRSSAGRARLCAGLAAFVTLASFVVASPAQAEDQRAAALAVSKSALDAYLAGDFKRAATMYRTAWMMNPDELLYLYNSARAAQRDGATDAARRDYQLFLAKAPKGHVEAAKARHHLAELDEDPGRSNDGSGGAIGAGGGHGGDARPQNSSSAGASRSTVGWAVLIAGTGVAVGGVVVLALAQGDQSTLDQRLTHTDDSGYIVGISKPEAEAQQKGINSRFVIGWGLAGFGAAAVVVGGVLVATSPTQSAALVPWADGHGATFAMRF